ncbi:MAG: hypothetical protein K9H06_15620 [Melioribacteraceae bacterium]|nr:hypothetical protein [Melioribacteraceae bacterium]MCF8420351.1 hypothetical protein [Melioribacteraceae bacterium]
MNNMITDNNVVMISDDLNPVTISEKYFIDAGIIQNEKEIDLEKIIRSPFHSNYEFKDGIIFQLSHGRLLIGKKNESDRPYEIGEIYLNSFPYYRLTALGINIQYNVDGIIPEDFFKLYESINHIRDYKIQQISLRYKVGYSDCNLTIGRIENSLSFRFNFDYQLKGELFKSVDLKLAEEYKKDKIESENFLNEFLEKYN